MENINILINESRIEKRIEEIAMQIERDYIDEEIVFLGILKGSVPFLWELSKRVHNKVKFEFIEVSSYGGTESTGKIKMNKEYLLSQNPKSLKIATLLSKPSRRIMELDVDYIGFKIEDKFVVGFGLDYNQEYRNLPYIGYIE